MENVQFHRQVYAFAIVIRAKLADASRSYLKLDFPAKDAFFCTVTT